MLYFFLIQEWRDMKVKKKAKWIRKAMKEFRDYEERVVEFKVKTFFGNFAILK